MHGDTKADPPYYPTFLQSYYMPKLDTLIPRANSVITGKPMEDLYTIPNFPVFMGCVDPDSDTKEDLFADMEWKICSESGIIQLANLIPLEYLYLNQHCEGIGGTWQAHYRSFSTFLQKYKPKDILEIGAAHGFIAKDYLQAVPDATWTIVEPNPTTDTDDPRITVKQQWFDDTFTYDGKTDAVVHTHVLEHAFDPTLFISHIASFTPAGGKHFISVPNMHEMLKRKYTNCINFEHTLFLTESLVDYLLEKFGFTILEKEYFRDHSIFYAAEKLPDSEVKQVELESHYDEYKKLFEDFIQFLKDDIVSFNAQMKESSKPTYLFGAHIFSQYLIALGLNTEPIVGILDNGPAKQGKRLYGTSILVDSPKILEGKGPVNLILRAGIYNDEIRKDIVENINDEVVFW